MEDTEDTEKGKGKIHPLNPSVSGWTGCQRGKGLRLKGGDGWWMIITRGGAAGLN